MCEGTIEIGHTSKSANRKIVLAYKSGNFGRKI